MKNQNPDPNPERKREKEVNQRINTARNFKV